MAGYLFTFSDKESLMTCMKRGIYATRLVPTLSQSVLSTLADFVTMKPDDNVYFFSKRKIYGMGRILEVPLGRAAFENFPGATSAEHVDAIECIGRCILPFGGGEKETLRWCVAFEPYPYLFERGVDMDDMLGSGNPAFKSLRLFWKRSFIKLDDQENLAFRSELLRANIDVLSGDSDRYVDPEPEFDLVGLRNLVNSRGGGLDVPSLLKTERDANGHLSKEMLLEVGLLYQLSEGDPETEAIFGKWDYLSHQVHASPFKPIDYMDKIDVFGYRWILDFAPVIEKYLIVELKKGSVEEGVIAQVMRYVDWAKGEYAGNDYSRLTAYIVGSSIDEEQLAALENDVERRYVVGTRPAESRVWNDLTLVTYYVEEEGHIVFRKVKSLA